MNEPTGVPTEGQIRLRAYRIWQWLGCPDGYEDEIWAQAERELTKAAEAADEERPLEQQVRLIECRAGACDAGDRR